MGTDMVIILVMVTVMGTGMVMDSVTDRDIMVKRKILRRIYLQRSGESCSEEDQGENSYVGE